MLEEFDVLSYIMSSMSELLLVLWDWIIAGVMILFVGSMGVF